MLGYGLPRCSSPLSRSGEQKYHTGPAFQSNCVTCLAPFLTSSVTEGVTCIPIELKLNPTKPPDVGLASTSVGLISLKGRNKIKSPTTCQIYSHPLRACAFVAQCSQTSARCKKCASSQTYTDQLILDDVHPADKHANILSVIALEVRPHKQT